MEGSSLKHIFGVFLTPAKTFESLGRRPTWVLALAIFTVLGVALGFAIHLRTDYRMVITERLEARGGQLDADQIERAVGIAEQFGGVGPIVAAMVIVGFALLMALIYMVIFRLLGGELSFKTSLATFAHGTLPKAVGTLLAIPLVLGRDSLSYEELTTRTILASNLGFLAPEEASVALKTTLAGFEFFSLWSVVLLAVGYRITARVSATTAAVTVALLWLLGLGLQVGTAMLRAGGVG